MLWATSRALLRELLRGLSRSCCGTVAGLGSAASPLAQGPGILRLRRAAGAEAGGRERGGGGQRAAAEEAIGFEKVVPFSYSTLFQAH